MQTHIFGRSSVFESRMFVVNILLLDTSIRVTDLSQISQHITLGQSSVLSSRLNILRVRDTGES